MLQDLVAVDLMEYVPQSWREKKQPKVCIIHFSPAGTQRMNEGYH